MSFTVRLAIVTVLLVGVGLVWWWSRRMLRRRLERETGQPQDGPWPPGRRIRDMTPLGKGLLGVTGLLTLTNLGLFVVAPGSKISQVVVPLMIAAVGGALLSEHRRVKDM